MMINCIMCTLKTLTDLCFPKQKIKIKNTFARVVYSVLVVKNVLTEHIETCLSINSLFEHKSISNDYQFRLKFMLILTVI